MSKDQKENLNQEPTDWIHEEELCWYLDQKPNDQQLFKEGKITKWDNQSQKASIKVQSQQLENVPAQQLYLRSGATQSTDDMVNMDILNEAELLMNLEKRFKHEKIIYTYVGSTVIVVNPFKKIEENYTEEVEKSYFEEIVKNQKDKNILPPHVFAMSAESYNNLFTNDKKQAIVISGESGAGKTINAKDCMAFLTKIGSLETTAQESLMGVANEDIQSQKQKLETKQKHQIPIEQKILNCNPILEAFGNAKTVKNNNSSRFGKYVKLIINIRSKTISGALIQNYLLEKARIIKQGQNERNFHIFYHFLFGSSPENLEKYFMYPVKNKSDLKVYNYLNQSKTYTADQIDDVELYQEVEESFETLGFQQEKHTIYSIIAAILLIGNLEFDKSTLTDTNPCKIKNQDVLKNVCKLLQINLEDFQESMTIKEIQYPGQKQPTKSPLTPEKCEQQRDSTAKLLYGELFTYLVKKLNDTILPEDYNANGSSNNTIGLLDIYGFEVFQQNGFEQLFINYTNEQLGKMYIKYVFQLEIQTFKDEGLSDYLQLLVFKDNQAIIDVIDKKPSGLFPALNDQCKGPSATDDAYFNKIKKELKNAKEQIKFPMMGKKFVICHSAKDVEYMCEEFIEKNMDNVPKSLLKTFNQSKDQLFSQELFPIKEEEQDHKGKSKQGVSKYLSYKFQIDMGVLMDELLSSECNFIRCIKSNDDKKPFIFWQKMSLDQVRCLGVLETIKVRKESFPIRKSYKLFYKKYQFISSNLILYPDLLADKSTDFKQLCDDLIKDNFPQVYQNTEKMLMGKNKIFLKAQTQTEIDQAYNQKIEYQQKLVKKVQKNYYRFKMIKKFRRQIYCIKYAQRAWKTHLQRKQFKMMKKAVEQMKLWWNIKKEQQLKKKCSYACQDIQAFAKTQIEKPKLQKFIKSIIEIQKTWRGYKLRKYIQQYRNMRKLVYEKAFNKAWNYLTNTAAIKIQKLARGYIVRSKHQEKVEKIKLAGRMVIYQKSVLIIQKHVRGFLCRKWYINLKNKTMYIQAWFKMYWLSLFYKNLKKASLIIQRNVRKWLITKHIKQERLDQYTQEVNQENIQNAEFDNLFEITQLSNSNTDININININSNIKENNSLINNDNIIFQNTVEQPFVSHKKNQSSIYYNKNTARTNLISDCSSLGIQFEFQPDTAFLNNSQVNEDIPSQTLQYFDDFNSTVLLNKVYLFSYIMDIQFLSDPVEIYQNPWSQDYKNIFQKCYFQQMYIQQIKIGETHTLLLNSNNKMFAYGQNDSGQLSQNDNQNSNQSKVPQHFEIHMVSTGDNHNLILSEDGELYGWGLNDLGQIKDNTEGELSIIYEPTKIPINDKFKFIATRKNLSYAVNKNGQVYKFGGENGQQKNPKIMIFKKDTMSNIKIKSISCGHDFTIFLSQYGELFSQGKNDQGQLGIGIQNSQTYKNTQKININEIINDVQCGFKHTIAKSKNGKLFTWGWGENGQLGYESSFQSSPQQIIFQKDFKEQIIQVAATYKGSYILTSDSKILVTGQCTKYQNSQNFIEYVYADNLPQFSNKWFYPVRIKGEWSITVSLLNITFAYNQKLRDESQHLKMKRSMNLLTQKWMESNIESLNPPYIDSLKNIMASINMKFPSQGTKLNQNLACNESPTKSRFQKLQQSNYNSNTNQDQQKQGNIKIQNNQTISDIKQTLDYVNLNKNVRQSHYKFNSMQLNNSQNIHNISNFHNNSKQNYKDKFDKFFDNQSKKLKPNQNDNQNNNNKNINISTLINNNNKNNKTHQKQQQSVSVVNTSILDSMYLQNQKIYVQEQNYLSQQQQLSQQNQQNSQLQSIQINGNNDNSQNDSINNVLQY